MTPTSIAIADLPRRPAGLRADARAWTVGAHAIVLVEGPSDDCWASVLDTSFGWTSTLRQRNGEEIQHFPSEEAALEAARGVAEEVETSAYVPRRGQFEDELARLRGQPRNRVELVRFLYWNDGNGSFDDLLTTTLDDARRQFDAIVAADG